MWIKTWIITSSVNLFSAWVTSDRFIISNGGCLTIKTTPMIPSSRKWKLCLNYEPNNCRYNQRRKHIISSLSLVCASRGAREVPFLVEHNPNFSVIEIVVSVCTCTVMPKSGIEIACDPVFQRTSFSRVRKRSCCRGRPWWRTDTCSPLSRSRARAWSDASWTQPRSKILQEGTPVHSPESCCLLFVGLAIALKNI